MSEVKIAAMLDLAERQRPSRLPYLRQYPPNTTWHGWLSANAIATLELAGNTVQQVGGSYRLNATEGR